MIDIPANEVIKKIVQETELSEEQVKERINEKLKQLSGLISEDGAAHIVANDLGIQMFKTEGAIKISELTTAAKNIETHGKVLNKYELREFNTNGRQGKVANLLLGDDSGKTRVVFWNDQTDTHAKINEGDILKIKNPLVKDNSGRLELHLNDRSEVVINPEGVSITVPEKQQEKRELKYLRDITGNESNVEVLGTIVQVYDTRFFDVCPECNKRVNEGKCVTHGIVTPMKNYVTSCFLDDGTGNIRVTFWKQQTQNLFGKNDDEIQKWVEDPSLMESAKHELLGEIVKLVGRANKNDQFDRMEFTAQLVFKDVDPEEELSKLSSASNEIKSVEKVDTSKNNINESSASSVPKVEEQSNEEVVEEIKEENFDPIEVDNSPKEVEKPKEKEESQEIDITIKKDIETPEIEEEVISIDDLEDL